LLNSVNSYWLKNILKLIYMGYRLLNIVNGELIHENVDGKKEYG